MTEKPWLAAYDPGVPHEVAIPAVTLPVQLDRTAERFAERPAVRFMGRTRTFAELQAEVGRCAALLADLGVRPGDRVALLFPNVPHEVVAYYGALRIGAVVVQVNPLGTAQDMANCLRDSGAKVLVALDVLLGRFLDGVRDVPLQHLLVSRLAGELPFADRVKLQLGRLLGKVRMPPGRLGEDFGGRLSRTAATAAVAAIGPEDLALLQYTGGTTGTPKAAMLTHRNLIANVEQSRAWEGSTPEGSDACMLVVPCFHVYGMTVGMNLSVRNARTMILQARFEAEAVMRAIQAFRPAVFPGVQVFYQRIAAHPRVRRYDLTSLKMCLSGAGPLMRETQEAFEAVTGARVVEGYGLTEASPVTHCNPLFGRRKIGTIGVPFPSTDAKLVDLKTGDRAVAAGSPGELCVRGPQVMRGYWNREAESREVLRDGWLHTGDIAQMDEEGFFTIVDRKKEMIKSGGENVYPRDIEEVLFRHPAVQDAGVVGVPDAKLGEMVKAFVVLKPGAAATPEALIAFCRASLSGFQTPKALELRAKLPRTEIGKLLRRVLVEEDRKRRGGTS